MAINKVAIDGNALIDLSTDTVASAEDIAEGKIGHLNDGTVVTGTHQGGVIPTGVITEGEYTPVANTKAISIPCDGYSGTDFLVWLYSKDCKNSAPQENNITYAYWASSKSNIIPYQQARKFMFVKMPDGSRSYYSADTHFALKKEENSIVVGISETSNNATFEGGKPYAFVVYDLG